MGILLVGWVKGIRQDCGGSAAAGDDMAVAGGSSPVAFLQQLQLQHLDLGAEQYRLHAS